MLRTAPAQRAPGRRRGFATVLFLLAGAALTWLLRGYLLPLLIRTEQLAPAEAREVFSVEALVARQEKVVHATATGRVVFVAGDGERLRTGSRVAEIHTGGAVHALTMPFPGVVSYEVDGWEGILAPERLDTLDMDKLDELFKSTRSTTKKIGEVVRKGEGLFKAVDNLAPIYLYVRGSLPEALITANRLEISCDGDVWKAEVHRRGKEGVWLKMSRCPDHFLRTRVVTLEVLGNRILGYPVPPRALVWREGQPGLFLVKKGRAHWVPVRIAGELKGQIAVEGEGLSPAACYVANPWFVRPGDRVY